MSWKSVADEITGTATGMNIQIVDNNWGDDEPVPGILCTDINRPEVTSEAISALVTCKALTPELPLENDLRGRYNLPTLTQQQRTAAQPKPVVPAPAPEPATAPTPAPEPAPAS